ncbi:hypothetical protein WOLCODRAFT_144201 [Wolfiporia cocos MD-104 SS10]|uniref:Uncharacterized protein n=1 Tax=Wolfiporia cocos (strain MD-104) TaxID=742152 RepID=A0A2H3JS79_WOLCO|nr:hypothetical protein WOLCODRAFT_144201 [Wolfiporia cocos MD-104 SS10]
MSPPFLTTIIVELATAIVRLICDIFHRLYAMPLFSHKTDHAPVNGVAHCGRCASDLCSTNPNMIKGRASMTLIGTLEGMRAEALAEDIFRQAKQMSRDIHIFYDTLIKTSELAREHHVQVLEMIRRFKATQSAYMLKFCSMDDIVDLEPGYRDMVALTRRVGTMSSSTCSLGSAFDPEAEQTRAYNEFDSDEEDEEDGPMTKAEQEQVAAKGFEGDFDDMSWLTQPASGEMICRESWQETAEDQDSKVAGANTCNSQAIGSPATKGKSDDAARKSMVHGDDEQLSDYPPASSSEMYSCYGDARYNDGEDKGDEDKTSDHGIGDEHDTGCVNGTDDQAMDDDHLTTGEGVLISEGSKDHESFEDARNDKIKEVLMGRGVAIDDDDGVAYSISPGRMTDGEQSMSIEHDGSGSDSDRSGAMSNSYNTSVSPPLPPSSPSFTEPADMCLLRIIPPSQANRRRPRDPAILASPLSSPLLAPADNKASSVPAAPQAVPETQPEHCDVAPLVPPPPLAAPAFLLDGPVPAPSGSSEVLRTQGMQLFPSAGPSSGDDMLPLPVSSQIISALGVQRTQLLRYHEQYAAPYTRLSRPSVELPPSSWVTTRPKRLRGHNASSSSRRAGMGRGANQHLNSTQPTL